MDEQQQRATQTVEAVKLLGDYAKWLVTIETTIIAAVTFVFTFHDPYRTRLTSVLAAFAVCFFVASITFAMKLLVALPRIMQVIEPNDNVLKARDRTRVKSWATSRLVRCESVCFAIGLSLLAFVLVVKIFDKPEPSCAPSAATHQSQ